MRLPDAAGKVLTRGCFERPLLIVGTGRSGTSILLQALGEHSRIWSSERESPFIPYVGGLMHPFELRHNKEYHLESLAGPQEYFYHQFRKLCFESALGPHYGLGGPGRKPAGFFQKVRRARRWCAKTFPNQIEADGLSCLYPALRFLYVFRNGCDVVHSMSKFQGMSHRDFEENCRIWARSAEKYRYLLERPEALCVRQEDLVARPDEVFRQVLDFAGLEFEEGPARFSKTTLIHSLDQKTRTGVDVGQALEQRPKPYLSWTGEQKSTFTTICSPGMQLLGYEIPF